MITIVAEMMEKENLHVNDTLYRVHYPAKPKLYIRCENAEQICVVEGNWALTDIFTIAPWPLFMLSIDACIHLSIYMHHIYFMWS